MKRNPLTPLKKMLQRVRRLYKAVLVLSGITAIVLTVLEELRNVEKRRRKPEDLPRDPDVTDSPTGDYSTDRLVKSVYPVWSGKTCIGTMCVFVQTPAEESVPAWHGRIREVTSWIARNPGERITVEGLARRARMTTRQLRGAFRGILGTSVTVFVRLQRLAAARRLLETTSDSVSDVAQACGFYDHSHFANAASIALYEAYRQIGGA